jgi:four helix bundle protein
MEPTKRFNELIVRQKAHQFVLNVYAMSSKFPKEEIYGLTSQFRRAAISIAANIAEGYGKKGKADKLRFFNITQGSLEECRYYLLLVKDLNFIKDNTHEVLLDEVSRLLNSYSRSISKFSLTLNSFILNFSLPKCVTSSK